MKKKSDQTLYSDITQNSLIPFSEMQNNTYVNITVPATVRSGATQQLSKYSHTINIKAAERTHNTDKQNHTPKNSQKSESVKFWWDIRVQSPKSLTEFCLSLNLVQFILKIHSLLCNQNAFDFLNLFKSKVCGHLLI